MSPIFPNSDDSTPTRTVTGTKNTYTVCTVYNKYGVDSVKRDDMRLCYQYDSFGRVVSQTEKSGADSYTTGYTYDANGMLQTRTFPSGFAVQYSYANGATTAIRKVSNNAAIWELTGANALGQITNYRHGGKYNVELDYDTYFNPTTKKLDGTTYAAQTVNSQTGNLTNRSVGTSTESFAYDSQYRLTSWYSGSATYSDNGNILTKTGAGTYAYDPVRKHAVTSVTAVTGANQTIDYNEMGMATSIEEGAYRLTLDYGVTAQRVKTFLYENGALMKEKHFASGYEKEIEGNSTKEISYIQAPSGLAAIVVRSGGIDSLFYIYTDHQGSILQLNNEAGAIVEQRVYDPWGRERTLSNWNNYLTDAGYRRTDRGYIGQEHLPQFGLINLNARLYDPVLGRFLSVDPFVQAPDLSQSYNRYSYCLNNPVIYTDPTGEQLKWWQWLLGDVFTGGAISSTAIMTATNTLGFVGSTVGGAIMGVGTTADLLTGGMVSGTFLTYFPFSDECYDMQKYTLPFAVKPDFRLGSNQGGIGIDASFGAPQMSPMSYRVHGGATYFWYNTDLMGNDMSGWETRYGAEWGIGGIYSYSGTTFHSGWSGTQTTDLMTIGVPMANIKYENDMPPAGPFNDIPLVPKGDGDRYRTAAVQINVGPFGIGTNIMTGDAGPNKTKNAQIINGHLTYVEDGDYNPNSYRMGTLYFRAGPFRLGRNSEGIRKVFQNEFAHDFITGGESKWFEVLDYLKPKWYWGFGYSGGDTLY